MRMNLRQGDSGLEVARIQTLLEAHGAPPNLHPRGIFGPKTDAAVRAFQRAHKLKDDGIVGCDTLGALMPFKTATIKGDMEVELPALKSGFSPPTPGGFKTPPLPLPNRYKVPDPPAPSGTSPTPTGNGAGWVSQVQPGIGVAFPPFLNTSPPVPPAPAISRVWTGSVQFGFTYRTASEGRHWEAGPLLQLGLNSRSHPSDPLITFSGGGQVTWADIFARGSWHFLSPQITAMFLAQSGPGGIDTGVNLTLTNQISLELLKDRFSIFLAPGLGGTLDIPQRSFQLGPLMGGGIIGQF